MASLKVNVELESDGDPIHGRLQVMGEAAVSQFTGWIEFIQALERARLLGGRHDVGQVHRS